MELNSHNTNTNNIQTTAVEDDSIDLKKIIFNFLRNWYWFVITVMIALSVALLYNKYATPVYEINSTILVEEENSSSSLGAGMGGLSQNVFQGLGGMGSMQNIHNQMVILSSTPIVSRTLDELDFEVSYYSLHRMVSRESYRDVPFQVIWDRQHPQLINAEFDVKIEADGKLQLSVEQKDVRIYNYDMDE